MASDMFYGQVLTVADPTNEPRTVTPSDSNDLPQGQPNYIYIGTEGDLTARYKDTGETNVTLKNLPVGWHPLRPTRIMSTGTTAADIVACY